MKSRMMKGILLIGTLANLSGQTEKRVDISTLATRGVVTENHYINSFFNLTVDAPNSSLQLNPLVISKGGRARLLQVLAKQANSENTYTLAVLADSISNYNHIQPVQYVRSVRLQLEKEGLSTVREEFPARVGGVEFTGAIMQERLPGGRKHYRGLYSTFRKAFILSFDVEAASQNKLNEIVSRLITFSE